MGMQSDAPDGTFDETFEAGVQYGDWKGQAKADDIGDGVNMAGPLRQWFDDDALIDPGEFVVGFKLWNEENGAKLTPIYVELVLVKAANFEAASLALKVRPIHARRVRREVGAEQFFRLFKRFSLALVHPEPRPSARSSLRYYNPLRYHRHRMQ